MQGELVRLDHLLQDHLLPVLPAGLQVGTAAADELKLVGGRVAGRGSCKAAEEAATAAVMAVGAIVEGRRLQPMSRVQNKQNVHRILATCSWLGLR